jgi:hypothetical protein
MLRLKYVLWLFLGLHVLCQALPAGADPVPPAKTVVSPPLGAVAQRPAAPDAEGFVPDSRPPNMVTVDETIPAAPLVATAYGFIWLMVIGFVLYTLRRTQKVEQELAELSSRIQAAAKTPRG